MSETVAELRDVDAERHLSTLAVLQLVLAGALAALSIGIAPSHRWGSSVVMAFALLVAVLARGLWRRSTLARAGSVVLAWCALPFVPAGTVFGVYALRVLGSERGRALFLSGAPGRVRPFGAVLVAQLSLWLCLLGTVFVASRLALPMLADAHRARIESTASAQEQP